MFDITYSIPKTLISVSMENLDSFVAELTHKIKQKLGFIPNTDMAEYALQLKKIIYEKKTEILNIQIKDNIKVYTKKDNTFNAYEGHIKNIINGALFSISTIEGLLIKKTKTIRYDVYISDEISFLENYIESVSQNKLAKQSENNPYTTMDYIKQNLLKNELNLQKGFINFKGTLKELIINKKQPFDIYDIPTFIQQLQDYDKIIKEIQTNMSKLSSKLNKIKDNLNKMKIDNEKKKYISDTINLINTLNRLFKISIDNELIIISTFLNIANNIIPIK